LAIRNAPAAAQLAGCQPAIRQTSCLRYVGGVCDAAFVCDPDHALLHFQSSGALHSPALTGFIRL